METKEAVKLLIAATKIFRNLPCMGTTCSHPATCEDALCNVFHALDKLEKEVQS